jgi:hypothetical protein
MLDVLIIHQNFKTYLETNVKITSKNNNVVLIGDDSIKFLEKYNNVKFYNYNNFITDEIKYYRDHFVNYSTNNNILEYICFERMFVMHEYLKQNNKTQVFHLDSDNILLIDINKVQFNCENAFHICKNYDNSYRMSNSIHSGLISLNMFNAFEKLYQDVYINKSKFNLIKEKIDYHKNNNKSGGICDMTFYYLLQNENIIEVQNLNEPFYYNNKKYVFLNNFNNCEGFDHKQQYNKPEIKNIIKDIQNNEIYCLANIHFQGNAKRFLNDDILTKLYF